jgi:hypothetical protein
MTSNYQNDAQLRMVQPSQPGLDTISLNFGFEPRLRIQHTLDQTTQFGLLDTRLPLRRHFKSHFTAAFSAILMKMSLPTPIFHILQPQQWHHWTKMAQLFCDCSKILTAV